MEYKKHKWFEYKRNSDENMEIIIKDGSGKKIASFKCNDKGEAYRNMLSVISLKYGFRFKKDSFNQGKTQSFDNEIDWLNKESLI